MRKSLLTLICLATLAAPRPAPAYPDSRTPHTVNAGGVSLTLLRDTRDQRHWYYLPASFIVAGTPAHEPEQLLLKGQVPAGDKLEEAAALMVALDLTLPPDVRQTAAAAVAALPVVDGQATAGEIKLDCVDLSDLKLTLFDEEGDLAEAAPDPALTPLPDPARVAFTAVARHSAASRLGNLLLKGNGTVKLRLDYSYAAGPGPVFLKASAAGVAGFGDYTKEDKDKAIFIFPPGPPDRVLVKLPQVSPAAGLAQVNYTFQLLGPDARLLAPATTVVWRDGVWRDVRKTRIYVVSLPVGAAVARGLKQESIVLRTDAEVEVQVGPLRRSRKAWAQAPLLSGEGDLPLALPLSPFRPLTVSGDYVDFRGGDDGIYMVQLAARCDSEQESAVLRGNKEGTLVPEPATLFFTDDCKTPALNLSYITGKGKRTVARRDIAAGEELVYLGNPE